MNDLFVFDTNSLVSASLLGGTTTARAIDHAITIGTLVFSNSTFDELIEVLFREKFDKYFEENERFAFLNKVELNSKTFTPEISIIECRDPKDNKFLELAFAAKASCIITGDQDLLVLHPFRGIPILTPADFLENF